jgi:hypothetical protein
MAAGKQSGGSSEYDPESSRTDRPDISACESCPGKIVFTESGNTDGWIASDTTVDIHR